MEGFIQYVDAIVLVAAVTGCYFFLKHELSDLHEVNKQLVEALRDLRNDLKEARASGSREHQMMVDSIHEHQKDSTENQKEIINAIQKITDKMSIDHLDQHKANASMKQSLIKIDTKLDSHVAEERKK